MLPSMAIRLLKEWTPSLPRSLLEEEEMAKSLGSAIGEACLVEIDFVTCQMDLQEKLGAKVMTSRVTPGHTVQSCMSLALC